MKRILLSFLVLILLNIVETEPSEFAKRLGKALIMMKKLKEEYKLRKLQEATDSTEDDTNTEKISTTNTSAPIQIFDFYGYQLGPASNGKISFTFKVLFYFLIPIPDTVMLPLKVTTGSLRQLQSGEQDIYATCTPTDKSETEADEQGGRSKEFTCSGEAEGSSISNVKYDDSRKIKTIKDGVTTSYPGGDVYFADGAQANKDQIDKAPSYAGVFVLKNGVVENTDENDGKFDIKGAMDKDKDINPINNQNLDLAISTSQNLTCTVSGSTDSSVITCDTNKEPMSETDLHGKSGLTSNNTKVYLTMIKGNSTITEGEYEAATSPTYRKSSSGLSGGAIAGIVIACVVVLIAAAVAAIMLRKPTPPPVDNTTVTGLQTVENM